jgi:hypothetical protein
MVRAMVSFTIMMQIRHLRDPLHAAFSAIHTDQAPLTRTMLYEVYVQCPLWPGEARHEEEKRYRALYG